jgi:DNA-binding NtrC family response regulator
MTSGHETERVDRDAKPLQAAVVLLLHHRDGARAISLQDGDSVVVGRSEEADVVVDDASLSRRHAKFTFVKGALVVVDLGSTNGTRVAGVRLEPEVARPLVAGDVVELGDVGVYVHGAPTAAEERRLLSHERFMRAVDDEIARGRAFSRSFSVVTIQLATAHAGRVLPTLLSSLRAVDRIAAYSERMIEVLLTETASPETATQALINSIASVDKAAAGVAVWPEAGARADTLCSAARAAILPGSPTPRRAPAVQAQPMTFATDDDLLVAAPAMRTLMETVERAAKSNAPVLLVGETGSGKEVVARRLHAKSSRAKGPLVAVNCGAIPQTLVESTLFGHEKGSFTGATEAKKGVFEAADGGTVLLDELGELPLAAQTALLRVLETKRVQRVGATKEREVDVRIVAATHRDLDAMVEAGQFRQDLLFRLNVLTMRVPPLRERVDEIAPLADRFVSEAAKRYGANVSGISDEARESLKAYTWPGNVRELKNALERAVVIATGNVVDVDDLPESIRQRAPIAASTAMPAPTGQSLSARVDAFEAQCILEALDKCGHSVSTTAELLQIPKRTLQHKMKMHGITRKASYAR